MALAISATGDSLYSAHSDHVHRQWDLGTGELTRRRYGGGTTKHVGDLSRDDSADALVACGMHGHVDVWSEDLSTNVLEVPGGGWHDAPIQAPTDLDVLAPGQHTLVWAGRAAQAWRVSADADDVLDLDIETDPTAAMDLRLRIVDAQSHTVAWSDDRVAATEQDPELTRVVLPEAGAYAIELRDSETAGTGDSSSVTATLRIRPGLRAHRVVGSATDYMAVPGTGILRAMAHAARSGHLLTGMGSLSNRLAPPEDPGVWISRPPDYSHGRRLDLGATVAERAIKLIVVSADGRRAIVAFEGGHIVLADPEQGVALRHFESQDRSVSGLALDERGNRAFVGTLAGYERPPVLAMYDLDTGARLRSFVGLTGHVYRIALSPDGRQLVTGTRDGLVVWDVEQGSVTADLAHHPVPVGRLAFSPDGTRLASGDTRGGIAMWDTVTYELLWSLPGADQGAVRGLAVSMDGAWVLASHLGGSARLLDAQDGQEAAVLLGHDRPVQDVAFAPDGSQAIAASRDGTIRFYDLSALREPPE